MEVSLVFIQMEKNLKLQTIYEPLKSSKQKNSRLWCIIIPVVLVGVILYTAIYTAVSPRDDTDGDGFSDLEYSSAKKED